MATHAWVVWVQYGREPWRLDDVVYATRGEARQNARLIRSGAPDLFKTRIRKVYTE
jgi:hypothetical protein